MSVLCVLLAVLFSHGGPALAADGARSAEDARLSESMAALARKAQWDGVERAYESLTAPTAEDHLLGAQASRRQGDLDEVVERLAAAIEAGAEGEALDWQEDVLARSRPVRVEGRELVTDPPPFSPDEIATLDRISDSLAAVGRFRGRAWVGRYVLDGHPVEVVAGKGLQTLAAPEPTPGAVAQLPVPADAAAASEPVTPRAPEAPTAPRDRTGPSAGRVALLSLAGGLVGTSAALYATGASRRARWADADDIRDVRALQGETNRYTTLAGGSLGLALGVGTLGIVVH